MQSFRKLQVWEKSHDLKYFTADQYAELMDTTVRVKKMLTALVKNVRMNNKPAPITDNR